MGDRALVQFVSGDKKEVSPVVYIHWAGSKVKEYLKELAVLMADRPNDASYACARFIGIVHSHDSTSNLSLGVWNKADILTKADSHGDAGCFVVDCSTWKVKCTGGYGKSFNAAME
jgi:hypothetical protein